MFGCHVLLIQICHVSLSVAFAQRFDALVDISLFIFQLIYTAWLVADRVIVSFVIKRWKLKKNTINCEEEEVKINIITYILSTNIKKRRLSGMHWWSTRSYFSKGNSVSFPEKAEKGWGFDSLCMRSPGVRGFVLMHRFAPRRSAQLQEPVVFFCPGEGSRYSTYCKRERTN